MKNKFDNNFFDIVKWNMVKFFGFNEDDASGIIENFKKEQGKKNDSFYLRYGSYHTASMIYHYDNSIETTWNSWRDQQNYKKPPQESIEYYNAYFKENN